MGGLALGGLSVLQGAARARWSTALLQMPKSASKEVPYSSSSSGFAARRAPGSAILNEPIASAVSGAGTGQFLRTTLKRWRAAAAFAHTTFEIAALPLPSVRCSLGSKGCPSTVPGSPPRRNH